MNVEEEPDVELDDPEDDDEEPPEELEEPDEVDELEDEELLEVDTTQLAGLDDSYCH